MAYEDERAVIAAAIRIGIETEADNPDVPVKPGDLSDAQIDWLAAWLASESIGRLDNPGHTVTIDFATGEWLNAPKRGITGEQAARVAASVLPGTTPEQVAAWYKEGLDD